MATQILDVKGLNCPIPLMKAKKGMKALSSGETLQILSTDPGSVGDFGSYCRATGNELLESNDDGSGVFSFMIRKA